MLASVLDSTLTSFPLQTDLDCYVSAGDRLSCVYNDFAAATGSSAVFGLILGGVLMVAMYNASDGSLIVPAVVLILLGGFLVPILPAAVSGISGSIVILGLAAAVFAGLRRYALEGVR